MVEVAALALTKGDDSPSDARVFVARHLSRVDVDRCADVVLLVSELVTNVIRHGELPAHLVLDVDHERILVSVYDSGRALPPLVPSTADEGAGTGRGLIILNAIARSWGVTVEPTRPGKDVWFDLTLTA